MGKKNYIDSWPQPRNSVGPALVVKLFSWLYCVHSLCWGKFTFYLCYVKFFFLLLFGQAILEICRFWWTFQRILSSLLNFSIMYLLFCFIDFCSILLPPLHLLGFTLHFLTSFVMQIFRSPASEELKIVLRLFLYDLLCLYPMNIHRQCFVLFSILFKTLLFNLKILLKAANHHLKTLSNKTFDFIFGFLDSLLV